MRWRRRRRRRRGQSRRGGWRRGGVGGGQSGIHAMGALAAAADAAAAASPLPPHRLPPSSPRLPRRPRRWVHQVERFEALSDLPQERTTAQNVRCLHRIAVAVAEVSPRVGRPRGVAAHLVLPSHLSGVRTPACRPPVRSLASPAGAARRVARGQGAAGPLPGGGAPAVPGWLLFWCVCCVRRTTGAPLRLSLVIEAAGGRARFQVGGSASQALNDVRRHLLQAACRRETGPRSRPLCSTAAPCLGSSTTRCIVPPCPCLCPCLLLQVDLLELNTRAAQQEKENLQVTWGGGRLARSPPSPARRAAVLAGTCQG